MNISGVFQELSCVNTDNDYESFSFDRDWQPFSGTNVAISPDGMLYDSLELYNRSIQTDSKDEIVSNMHPSYGNSVFNKDWLPKRETTGFVNQQYMLQDIFKVKKVCNSIQCSSDHADTTQNSQINTGTAEGDSYFNEKHNNGVYPTAERASPGASLSKHGGASFLESSYNSDAVDLRQSQTEDHIHNLPIASYDISFALETCPNSNVVEITPGSYQMDDSADDLSHSNLDPDYKQMTIQYSDKIIEKNNDSNGLKSLKEKNREAARAYRKRKRNKELELEIKLGILKKKKVALEEQLTSLKELCSEKSFHQLTQDSIV